MKKKTLLLAVIAICMAITVSGTLAYYTAEETAHNVITSGGVGIELVEKTKDETGSLVDFPEEGIHGVMPATSVYKMVHVENTGAAEAWIRIKVESSISASDGVQLPIVFEDDNTPVMSFEVHTGWVDGGDGYYYYETPVASGEATGLFMETVDFNASMGNEYQNSTANIVISVQAVQTANNGDSVMEAEGWPQD